MQAAVYGMTYFQHYLVTRKFMMYTDYKPLCKLSSTQVKTLNRLQLKMTELSPETRYIAGKNNTVANFLSRYHGLGAEEKKTEVREYSSKHQGLGIAQIAASAPRIRALATATRQQPGTNDQTRTKRKGMQSSKGSAETNKPEETDTTRPKRDGLHHKQNKTRIH
jgi:hypothetical protein